MTLQRQIGFWLACLAGFIGFIYLFSGVLMPFVAAIILAYLLDRSWTAGADGPLAPRGDARHHADGDTRLRAVAALGGAGSREPALLLPREGAGLCRAAAGAARRAGWPTDRADRRPAAPEGSTGGPAGRHGRCREWAGGVLTSIISGGSTVVGLLSLLVLTPVIAFYLLLDWDHMVRKVDGWLPREQAPVIRDLVSQMDQDRRGIP